MYDILPYTKQRAKELDVIVKPSIKQKYKIDVFDMFGNYITSCGARNYFDYPHYMKMEKNGDLPPGYSTKRRILYHNRHKKEASNIGSRGYFSLNLLW